MIWRICSALHLPLALLAEASNCTLVRRRIRRCDELNEIADRALVVLTPQKESMR